MVIKIGFDEIKAGQVDAVMLRLVTKVWGTHSKNSAERVVTISPNNKIEASIAFREIKRFLI